MRHRVLDGRRHIEATSCADPDEVASINPATGELRLRMPIEGDRFVPLYAYKALMRIALSIMPPSELGNFTEALKCLHSQESPPPSGSMRVGFSFSHVGNAPPALAGVLLRHKPLVDRKPYVVSIFAAGNVCFQIWLRSDSQDEGLPDVVHLGFRWTSQLPMPEGGYHAVEYSDPVQLNWSGGKAERQPFEAFELRFDPRTQQGNFVPFLRDLASRES